MKIKLDFHSKKLQKIIDILHSNSGSPRIIGGAVRDAFLGRQFSDIDIATKLKPEEVTRIFESKGYKVIPTGIDHGTVTIHTEEADFEVTTLRKDVMTDGRRAIVEFTDDFEVDASRRDFTINALSYDIINSELYDYFGGIADLEAGEVRFIGDPDARIKEDYLRILRFFRFSSYYSSSLDQAGLDACKNNASQLVIISRERINQEFSKILFCPKDISFILKAMEEGLVLGYISKGFDIDISGIINFEEKLYNEEQVKLFVLENNMLKILRLIFLLFSMGKREMKEYMQSLRFANKEIELCGALCNFVGNIIDLETKKEIYYELCKVWYYSPRELSPGGVELTDLQSLRSKGYAAVFDNRSSSHHLNSRRLYTPKSEGNIQFKESEILKQVQDDVGGVGDDVGLVQDNTRFNGQSTPSVINYCLIITYILGSIDTKELFAGIKEMEASPPLMPVPSEEIMKSGYEGIALGVRKRYLEKSWIKSGFSLSKEELLNQK